MTSTQMTILEREWALVAFSVCQRKKDFKESVAVPSSHSSFQHVKDDAKSKLRQSSNQNNQKK